MIWQNKLLQAVLFAAALQLLLQPYVLTSEAAAALELGQTLPGPMCTAMSKLESAHKFKLDKATLEHSIVNSGGGSHGFNGFLHKLVHHPAGGPPLNVVIQGGSFSSGAGLDPPESLYAERLVRSLQKLNPDAQIKLINSAVGESVTHMQAHLKWSVRLVRLLT